MGAGDFLYGSARDRFPQQLYEYTDRGNFKRYKMKPDQHYLNDHQSQIDDIRVSHTIR